MNTCQTTPDYQCLIHIQLEKLTLLQDFFLQFINNTIQN